MTRKGHSVVFAALLLVAQLLSAAASGGAVSHDGSPHCGGCPENTASGMTHVGTPNTDDDAGHCSGCAHGGSTDRGQSPCDVECALPGNGHCGSPSTPALTGTTLLDPASLNDSFGSDRRSVQLPDSPLFDLLRPPTRA